GVPTGEIAARGNYLGESYATYLCGSTVGRLQAVWVRQGTGPVGAGGISGDEASVRESGRKSDWLVLRVFEKIARFQKGKVNHENDSDAHGNTGPEVASLVGAPRSRDSAGTAVGDTDFCGEIRRRVDRRRGR